ncbi:hypothetical protein J7E62_31125 [Variovorax paradoxus]|nr:hypothetical protein [Variovorax paradoxus]
MRIDVDRSATQARVPQPDGEAWTALIDEYELALRSVERDYPMLNPDRVEFREDVMLHVYEMMKLLVKQGNPPALAVQLAAVQRFGN